MTGAAGQPWPSCLFPTGSWFSAERTHDRFGVAFDDSQQNAGRTVRYATALLPILHGTRIETETVRKLLPTQPHSLP